MIQSVMVTVIEKKLSKRKLKKIHEAIMASSEPMVGVSCFISENTDFNNKKTYTYNWSWNSLP